MGNPAVQGVPALGGGGAVTSVNTRTGAVVLTAADVGAGQLPAGVLLDSGIIIPSGANISGILGTSSAKAAAGNDARLSDTRTPTDGTVTDAKVAAGGLTNAALAAAAAIALSKLATDPLARANHTGTQTMSTISDAGALATKSSVATADITDGTIAGGDLNVASVISALQGQVGGLAKIVSRSSAGSTITGTTVLASDAVLQFAMGASDTWIVIATAIITFANASGTATTEDVKLSIAGPTGVTGSIFGIGNAGGGADLFNTVATTPNTVSSPGGALSSGGAVGTSAYTMIGYLVGDASHSGVIAVQLAQQTSDASTVQMAIGSHMIGWRVA